MNKITLYLMNYKGYSVLETLIENGYQKAINYIVTSEDRSVVNDYQGEIRSLCQKWNLDCFSRNEKLPLHTGFSIAVGWRWIILQQDNLIVFHDSILPKYRGFNPLVSALINGEKSVGVTALYAEEEYDKGEIIAQELMSIEYPIKIQLAIQKISELYKKMAIQLFDLIASEDEIISYKQCESEASYSLWRDERDYHIDWNSSAERISRFIDAVGFPYKGALSNVDDELIRIIKVSIEPDVSIENRMPGKTIFLRNGLPTIVCGKDLITIQEAYYNKDNKPYLPQKKMRVRYK